MEQGSRAPPYETMELETTSKFALMVMDTLSPLAGGGLLVRIIFRTLGENTLPLAT